MRVVCTAGHVDHGKSTLVRALTGMEPDRFAEERRRGLTIDLGFAWTELERPDGAPLTVAFVDLPGHERFIGNMLAGAGAVDLALLVVAADEGWMPQSREHLEILDLLGVRHGLVAVTKADAVDPDTLEVAVELTREELAGSAFEGVEIVAVSARTGAGLDRLRERLVAAVDAAPNPVDVGRPRLWVDRAFRVRGAGTVVTGTLAGGTLHAGAEPTVLPGGARGRVRGLQSLSAEIPTAAPGSRVALNLSGVSRDEVRRGDAVVVAQQWVTTDAFEGWVRPVRAHAIGKRGAWHVHVGSAERLARVTPLTVKAVQAAGGFIRVETDEPLALVAGDRFVLREAGRQATIGGGVILDPAPQGPARGRVHRLRRAEELTARREALDAGDRARLLLLHVAERCAAGRASAVAAAGLTDRAGAEAALRHGLIALGDQWAAPQAVADWSAAVLHALGEHHRAQPVDRVARRDVALRAVVAAGCPEQLAQPLLDHLVASRTLVAEGPGLRLPEHTVELDRDQRRARDELLAALAAEPFAPPGLAAAAAHAGASPALLRELEADGALVRLEADIAVTADALVQAHRRLAAAYEDEGPLTASRARQVLHTSRKFALPLLGELDRRGLTRRRGDVRDVRAPG